MTEFDNLSILVAKAALSAELEYVRWTKVKSILDMGCENMLSTSAARAASAFYGLNDNVTVVLEEKLSTLYQTIGVKSLRKRTGRVDCVVYKGNYPYVLIECKRYLVLNEIKSDVQRCCELIDKLNDKIKSALIVGLRAVHEEDKTDRTLETKKISDDLCKLYPKSLLQNPFFRESKRNRMQYEYESEREPRSILQVPRSSNSTPFRFLKSFPIKSSTQKFQEN